MGLLSGARKAITQFCSKYNLSNDIFFGTTTLLIRDILLTGCHVLLSEQ